MKIQVFASALAAILVPASTDAQPDPMTANTEQAAASPIAAELFKGRDTERLEPAVTPLVVQPFTGAEAEALSTGRGIAFEGSVLAAQPLRPLGAIATVIDGRRLVLPLTIFGKVKRGGDSKVVIPTDPARRGWCNLREDDGAFLNCYVDKDGDGRLETRRRAHSRFLHRPIGIDYVLEEEAIRPFPYVAADTSEYPSYRLEYRRCRSGNERVVYTIAVDLPTGPDLDGTACSGLAEPLGGISHGDAGQYRIDRVVVQKVASGPDAEFRLIEPIKAETLLDRVEGGEGIVDLGTRPAWWQEKLRKRAEFAKPPYIFATGPVITAAEGGEGDIMFTGTLGYSYTGIVTGDAISGRLFDSGSVDLSKGQPVYGLPMRLEGRAVPEDVEPQLYWCAPHEIESGKWRATCFLGGETSQAIYENVHPAFMAQAIYGGALGSDAVSVKRGPVSFGTEIPLRYEFREWDDEELEIRVHVGPGDSRRDSYQTTIRHRKGETLRLALGGGVYEVRPSPDGKGYRITMVEQPTAGGSAIPVRAISAGELQDALRRFREQRN